MVAHDAVEQDLHLQTFVIETFHIVVSLTVMPS